MTDTGPQDLPPPKTFKRETAVAMLAVALGLLIWGASGNAAAEQSAEALLAYAVPFAALAFGLDAYSKQLKP